MLFHLPVKFFGTIKNAELLFLLVPENEIAGVLPQGIRPKLVNGKVPVSVINLLLYRLHPISPHFPVSFTYRHVALRIITEVPGENADRGLYYFSSFSEKPFIAWAGKNFTLFHYNPCRMQSSKHHLDLFSRRGDLHYTLQEHRKNSAADEWSHILAKVDLAYIRVNKKLMALKIEREKWPLEEMEVKDFSTTFFQHAEVVKAFRVTEDVPYVWGKLQIAA